MNTLELPTSVNDELSPENPALVINMDFSLRHALAANCLGIDLSPANTEWVARRSEELDDILQEPYGNRIVYMDAAQTRQQLNDATVAFQQAATARERTPYIIGLDPAFLDPSIANYVFQETRVSIIGSDNPVIDIENNPRDYANRFVHWHSPNNGAGKSQILQMQEIGNNIAAQTAPVSIALVEDYINTGRSLANRFSEYITDPDLDVTILSGLVNEASHQYLDDEIEVKATNHIQTDIELHHMDVTDLLPTLGGRAIGWRHKAGDTGTTPVLYTTNGTYKIPMAVDAICGNYPWQADIYKQGLGSALMRRLGRWCLSTSLDFWASLETAAGQELSWGDLRPLNGTLRLYYPTKDLTHHNASGQQVQLSPRRSIEAISVNGEWK
jgi:hypothetical protein